MKRLIAPLSLFFFVLTLSPAHATAGTGTLSRELADAVNEQINQELAAGYIYLNMANHFNQQALFGFGHWYTAHFYEELNHARMMMKFLVDRNHPVVLRPVAAPPERLGSYVEIVTQSLRHEEAQSQRIHNLYERAKQARAYDLETFLIFFVKEQVEEEATFTDLLQKVTLVQSSPEGLLALDRELAKRKMPELTLPE